jgi:hypothetical protein
MYIIITNISNSKMFSLAKVFDFYYTTTFKSPVEWYRSPLTKPAAIAAALFA